MKLIENELNFLKSHIIECLSDGNNHISEEICDYLNAKSKHLRPALVFLFAKSLDIKITKEIYTLACAVELIHNSTLVHDDILDNADTRRGKISLNIKLGNNLSVLAGDTLLSIALKELVKCQNIAAIETFANSIYFMCRGEINQNFSIGLLPDLDEYILKSEHKTAELYKAALVSLAEIFNIQEKSSINEFATNFGIAFQIKDDLLNLMETDNTKPALSDIHNGIFTAPVIYLNEDVQDVLDLSEKEIINKLHSNKKYFDKTIELIKKYADKAISAIDFIPDNDYKQEIINLTKNLYKV